MATHTDIIKRTRFVASGYTKPRFACYDCDQVTGSVVLVFRSNLKVFVHKAGSGCHKGMTSSEVREPR